MKNIKWLFGLMLLPAALGLTSREIGIEPLCEKGTNIFNPTFRSFGGKLCKFERIALIAHKYCSKVKGFADSQCGKVLEQTLKAGREERAKTEVVYYWPGDERYEYDFFENAKRLIFCKIFNPPPKSVKGLIELISPLLTDDEKKAIKAVFPIFPPNMERLQGPFNRAMENIVGPRWKEEREAGIKKVLTDEQEKYLRKLNSWMECLGEDPDE